ncbi:MAG: MFS transporter [Phenylobacterium sp.]|uniref:MFS transporter n=1 Tax=Phenylobacterium sp. TaxID=1871053 RepID=UPI002735FCA6|nr:MFS transporter [Phenylobacterium sp.]MDP3175262.1 MFS transporter [Phenylobacterium sp.]
MFANGNFRHLWAMGIIVSITQWTELLVVALYVHDTTHSAFAVAVLATCRLLPFPLLSANIGMLVAHISPRTLQIYIALAITLSSMTIATLHAFGALQLWMLAVLVFVNGAMAAADMPLRRLMIGDAVGAMRMRQAMAVDMATGNVSRIAGPLVGGVVATSIGMNVFWFSAVAFLGFAYLSVRLRLPKVEAVTTNPPYHLLFLNGIRLVARDSSLTGVFVLTAIYNLFAWPMMTQTPVVASDSYRLAPVAVGVLVSMEGVGAFLSALTLHRISSPRHYPRIFAGGVIAGLTCIVLFGLAPNAPLAGVALFTSGLAGAGFGIMQATLIYMLTPAQSRGVVLGLLATCIGLSPLGVLHLGVMADALGSRTAVLVMGLEGLVITMLSFRLWGRIEASNAAVEPRPS